MAGASVRDIRLDLFRGLALWFIFLDHIPTNIASWLTVRNYGFSDATEIFVFISGYTAVIAYSRMMAQEGWTRSAARIYRRVWQLYVAHILLFVAFSAQIAWVSIARDTPALIEEMELLGLGQNPYRAILEAALLKFRPVNLDVLPLYIVLLAAFPLVLPAVVRWPFVVLAVSLGLYAATCHLNWNLPAYPEEKVWFFNPLAWQVVFHLGAVCAVLGPKLAWLDRFRTPLTVLAVAFILFAAFISLSWHYNPLERLVPHWVGRVIYPIDKTNIDTLRILHFLAVAWLVRLAVPIDAPGLRWPVWRPLRRCGEASLLIFCLGTFLALSGQVIVSYYEETILSQIVVSIAGIAIMCLAAYIAAWSRSGGSGTSSRRPAVVEAYK
ncbi:MAG: OpgC domain-containing protein [Reyranella sp.]|uniref:OpgC family protein n=1 Tax=Reyranella sp. TaxID=1929291 RepID=UPI0025CC7A73|nr:OpgC domain-containing protein [Reyranella sp.]MBR2818544.1 OpgC domain-containing protein [Reyranella sp.]